MTLVKHGVLWAATHIQEAKGACMVPFIVIVVLVPVLLRVIQLFRVLVLRHASKIIPPFVDCSSAGGAPISCPVREPLRKAGIDEGQPFPTVPGWTELHHAVASKDLPRVTQLLELGVNSNAAAESHVPTLNPLMLACCTEPCRSFKEIWEWTQEFLPGAELTAEDSLPMVRLLLRAGASPNVLVDGLTPLLLAIKSSNPGSVQALLAAGADPKSSASLIIGPVYLAIMCEDVDILAILLAHGADPNEKEVTHQSAALTAAAYCHSVEACQLLLKHGADVKSRNKGFTALDAAISPACPFRVPPRALQARKELVAVSCKAAHSCCF